MQKVSDRIKYTPWANAGNFSVKTDNKVKVKQSLYMPGQASRRFSLPDFKTIVT
jgi:hypothetical protein